MANDILPWDANKSYTTNDTALFNGVKYYATEYYDSSFDGKKPTEAMSKDDKDSDVRVWSIVNDDGTIGNPHMLDYGTTLNFTFKPFISCGVAVPYSNFDYGIGKNIGWVSKGIEPVYGYGNEFGSISGKSNSVDLFYKREAYGFDPYYDTSLGQWVSSGIYPEFFIDEDKNPLDGSQCFAGLPLVWDNVYQGYFDLNCFLEQNLEQDSDGKWVTHEWYNPAQGKDNSVYGFVQWNHPMFYGATFNLKLFMLKETMTMENSSKEEADYYANNNPEEDPDFPYDPFTQLFIVEYPSKIPESKDPPNIPSIYYKFISKSEIVTHDYTFKSEYEENNSFYENASLDTNLDFKNPKWAAFKYKAPKDIDIKKKIFPYTRDIDHEESVYQERHTPRGMSIESIEPPQ